MKIPQKTPQNQRDMIDLLLSANTLPIIEETQQTLDQWLIGHPEDNDVNSPIWQALGQMTSIEQSLRYKLTQGVDLEAEAAQVEAEVAALLDGIEGIESEE